MLRYHRQNSFQSFDYYVQNFPYQAYLNVILFTDFPTLQADRRYLWQQYGEGDEFLFRLGDAFVRTYPVSMGDLEQKIMIAEAFLSAKGNGIDDRNNEPYRMIGYFILNRVAQLLQQQYAAGKFNPDSPLGKQIVTRLANNRVHLALDESGWSKLHRNLSQGNYSYVMQRLWQKVSGRFQSSNAAGRASTAPTIRLSMFRRFYKSSTGHAYEIYEMVPSASQSRIGFAIFFRRPDVHARYFADRASSRFHQTRQNGRVLLAATGGFTNNYSIPEGLSVEEGRLVNAVLMPDRHGLVLVQPSGGIRVLNLKRSRIDLPRRNGRGTQTIRNPLESLIDYSRLIQWCRRERATVFQTQLMAFSDTLLIDPGRASRETAERRMLALVRNRKDNSLHHVIFDIPTPQTLYDISAEILAILHARNFKVEALLNLDTGGQNVLYVYDDRGVNIQPLVGTRPSQQATNLLLYTRP